MKKTIQSSLCIVICSFLLFYSFHFYSYNRCLSFIKEWNASEFVPYQIDFESITIERKLFSSPFTTTISILNMRLIFKNNDTVVTSNGKITLNLYIFGDQKQATIAQLVRS